MEAAQAEKRQRMTEVIQKTAKAIVKKALELRDVEEEAEEAEEVEETRSSHGEAEVQGEPDFPNDDFEYEEEEEDPDFLQVPAMSLGRSWDP